MIGKLFRIFLFTALIGLIMTHLLSRQQKRSIHHIIKISAKVCLAAAAISLLWYYFLAHI